MTITQQRVTCKCGHVFEAEVVMEAPIAVVAASMEAIHCPKCGSHEIGLGGGYSDSPPLTASIQDRAMWWRRRGEVGTSSLTIWCAYTGGQGVGAYRDYNYPLDPDDFRRCKQLLDLIPEWLGLGKVVERFPWFKPFADRWQEFDALYVKESPKHSCPELYEAMQVACREAEALRRGKPKA